MSTANTCSTFHFDNKLSAKKEVRESEIVEMNIIEEVDPHHMRQDILLQNDENILNSHLNQTLLAVPPITNGFGSRRNSTEQPISPVSATANDKNYINTKTKR